jgi:hypothetical protein
MKMAVFSDAFPRSLVSAGIALMIRAASYSETSVKVHQTTQCNIPEDSHLQHAGLIYVHIPKRVDHPLHYFKIK